MSQEQIKNFLQAALECSVYIAPRDPGLTHEEIFTAGKQAGFAAPDITKALPLATDCAIRARRLMPHSNTLRAWGFFHTNEEPDFRNFAALDFVVAELRAKLAAAAENPELARELLVERAAARPLPLRETEAAIATLVMAGHVLETGNRLRLAPGRESRLLPGELRARSAAASSPKPAEFRAHAYPIVERIVASRVPGDPLNALDQIAEELAARADPSLPVWWQQIAAELRRTDAATPLAAATLAASLLSAALQIALPHGPSPLNELIAAASSGECPIFNAATRHHAETIAQLASRVQSTQVRPNSSTIDIKSATNLVLACLLNRMQTQELPEFAV